jgi:hypothetical protein
LSRALQPRGNHPLRWRGDEYHFGVLNDLAAGISRKDYRPTYSSEQGLTGYGPLACDGVFVALCKRPQVQWLGFINGTFLSYEDRIYYQGLQTAMFQEDATAAPGIPSRFRWVGKL